MFEPVSIVSHVRTSRKPTLPWNVRLKSSGRSSRRTSVLLTKQCAILCRRQLCTWWSMMWVITLNLSNFIVFSGIASTYLVQLLAYCLTNLCRLTSCGPLTVGSCPSPVLFIVLLFQVKTFIGTEMLAYLYSSGDQVLLIATRVCIAYRWRYIFYRCSFFNFFYFIHE